MLDLFGSKARKENFYLRRELMKCRDELKDSKATISSLSAINKRLFDENCLLTLKYERKD